jgi:heptaprenyl diphosphate synthase
VAVAGVAFHDSTLEAAVRDRLKAVEGLLRDAVASDYPLLTETSRHLVDAGGKRFRPLLVLLASELGDPDAPGVLPAAVVVELTHLATLYHDDVMDEATMRRGARSANSRWDNTVAILTGDFLFSRASDILADLGPEPVRIQARTFSRLVQGQLRETVGAQPGEEPVEHYLRVLADKTGSLIATSARFGALLAGAGSDVVEAVTAFGETIGVAFQISDDLLDVAGEPTESGKTPGTDLREGIRTLPVLLALREESPTSPVRALLEGDLSDDGRLAEALAALREHPGMTAARAYLDGSAAEAKALATALPDGSAKDALLELADFVVARTG